MKKTENLYRIHNDNITIFNNYSDVEWDNEFTEPMPAEPVYYFFFENLGQMKKQADFWEPYIEGLLFIAYKEDLLQSEFGKVLYKMVWECDDDVWEMSSADINDAILMLRLISIDCPLTDEEKREIVVYDRLEAVRSKLISLFLQAADNNDTVYFYRA